MAKRELLEQKIITQIKKKIKNKLKELAFEDGNVDENWRVLCKELTDDFYTPGDEIKIDSVDYGYKITKQNKQRKKI